jgi:hypothetical protein
MAEITASCLAAFYFAVIAYQSTESPHYAISTNDFMEDLRLWRELFVFTRVFFIAEYFNVASECYFGFQLAIS